LAEISAFLTIEITVARAAAGIGARSRIVDSVRPGAAF
jgi:hypothetical protein